MRYQFADCVLDTGRHAFHRNAVLIPLEPQVFDLLHLLARLAGTLVTRDEMMDEIWEGRIVSESTVSARINAARRAVGDTGKLQDIIKTVPRRGFQMVADVVADNGPAPDVPDSTNQVVRYTRSKDGTSIAFAENGVLDGPPLLRAGHWMTDLEIDWRSPICRPHLEELGAHFRCIRYDQRGTGMSDRRFYNPTLQDFVDDMKAVADAAGLERFPILAASQGVPMAILFAVQHPERVSKLILRGGYAQGRALRVGGYKNPEEDPMLGLIRSGWGQPESAFMKALSSLFTPGATSAQLDDMVAVQLASSTPETAAEVRKIIDQFTVLDLLDQIQAPTLVIHARHDAIHPIEQGRMLASGIPGAQFMTLESNNHVPLPQEPGWRDYIDGMVDFLNSP